MVSGAELVATDGLVDGLRIVKEPVRSTASEPRVQSRTMRWVSCCRPWPRADERDFALQLEFAMRRRGASAVSFDPIVASGPPMGPSRTLGRATGLSNPASWCDRLRCIVDGYCSDMTRT